MDKNTVEDLQAVFSLIQTAELIMSRNNEILTNPLYCGFLNTITNTGFDIWEEIEGELGLLPEEMMKLDVVDTTEYEEPHKPEDKI